MAATVICKQKILFFLQRTRVMNYPGAGAPPPGMEVPSLILPLVYDVSTNNFQLPDKRDPGPSVTASANLLLKRKYDWHQQPVMETNGHECATTSDQVQSNGTRIADPSNLKFTEIPESAEFKKKADDIRNYLDDVEYPSVERLREFAISAGGLINDKLRRKGWPGLLGIAPDSICPPPSEAELRSHPEFGQVVLDVNRSIKRFPPGIPYDQRVALQEQLTNLILRVITKYPHLRYYQGYHDVAITILLVVGEDMAFRIMEKLSTEHLRDCMEPTMEKTSYLLNFVFPLVDRLSRDVCHHLDKSEAGTMFCLPWFLTWFGHSLNHYKDVVRLYDFFLASPPLMPIYLTAAIVVHRKVAVLEAECNMASVHCLLSQLPEDLPFEDLIVKAMKLYDDLPPELAEVQVKERIIKERELREAEEAARKAVVRRRRYRGLWRRIELLLPDSRAQLILLAVSVAMGFYAYVRANVAAAPVR